MKDEIISLNLCCKSENIVRHSHKGRGIFNKYLLIVMTNNRTVYSFI